MQRFLPRPRYVQPMVIPRFRLVPQYRTRPRYIQPTVMEQPKSKTTWKLIVIGIAIVVLVLYASRHFTKKPSTSTWSAKQLEEQMQAHRAFVEGKIALDVPIRREMIPPRARTPPPTTTAPLQFVSTKKTRKRLSKRQKERLLDRYQHRCKMCRRYLYPFDTQLDHWVPLATDKSGQHSEWLNHENNIVPLCSRCHSYKTAKEREANLYRRPRRYSTSSSK